MIPQHLSITNEHFTPPHIVKRSIKLLGNIDLDPASSNKGNYFINADSIFTKKEDGLSQQWWGNVFLNPPGGKIGNKSSQKQWFLKLFQEWSNSNIQRGLFIAFNLEIIRICPECLQFPVCILNDRPHYWSFNEEEGVYKPGQWDSTKTKWSDSPSHSTIIIYLPTKLPPLGVSKYYLRKYYSNFVDEFSSIGKCYILNNLSEM